MKATLLAALLLCGCAGYADLKHARFAAAIGDSFVVSPPEGADGTSTSGDSCGVATQRIEVRGAAVSSGFVSIVNNLVDRAAAFVGAGPPPAPPTVIVQPAEPQR